MEGIFFYLQTHKTELQEQRTKDAIKKSFQDAGITPFKDGEWKKYVETSFQTQGTPAASHILHKVHKLQQKTAISAYLFKLGLDDQNPLQGQIGRKQKNTERCLSSASYTAFTSSIASSLPTPLPRQPGCREEQESGREIESRGRPASPVCTS